MSDNVYTDVMEQAARECLADLPTDANDDQIAAMKAHHGFLICEYGQDTFEATEALIAQDVARRQLWAYPTPYKPEGYGTADEMIYTLITQAGRSRSRLSLMRGVGLVCEQAETWGVETDAAIRNWTNCREVMKHLKNACTAKNKERLTSILDDVVTIESRDELRQKYKGTDDLLSAGDYGVHALGDGTKAVLILATDIERVLAAIGKICDKVLVVEGKSSGGVITVRAFEQEQVGDLWKGVIEEPELEPVLI